MKIQSNLHDTGFRIGCRRTMALIDLFDHVRDGVHLDPDAPMNFTLTEKGKRFLARRGKP